MNEKVVADNWNANVETWVAAVRNCWDPMRTHVHDPVFSRLVGETAGQNILDVGCGEGTWCRAIARRRANVVGVDISERMIRFARDAEESEPLGIDYRVCSASNLGQFEAQSFDKVVSTLTLMDCGDIFRILAEIRRVLRRGGEFVFSVIHPLVERKGFRWIDNGSELAEFAIDNYFARGPWEEELTFPEAPSHLRALRIRTYPRTVGDYINALAEAGLFVAQLQEPKPNDCDRKLDASIACWNVAPLYMFVKARR